MNLKLFLMILASVGMASIAQLILKTGMSNPRVQEASLGNGHWLQAIVTALSNGHVLLGLGLYTAGAILWLFVLARVDVTMAYPFIGLGFVITMVLGAWLLSEPVGVMRIVGTLLIVAGVALISRS